ncbi:hypothetical protein MY11210_009270 [Beauveria gryllotalpidicola]
MCPPPGLTFDLPLQPRDMSAAAAPPPPPPPSGSGGAGPGGYRRPRRSVDGVLRCHVLAMAEGYVEWTA